MGLLKQWRDVAYSQQADKAKLQKFWAEYFVIEKGIYEQLLSNPDEVVRGTVKELADKYKVNVMTMTGFLDGINDSLKVQNPIEEMEEDTEVNLGFDKELLYKNMVDAKADWLYERRCGMKSLHRRRRKLCIWNRRNPARSSKVQKLEEMIHVPYGSGKKYKFCCGRIIKMVKEQGRKESHPLFSRLCESLVIIRVCRENDDRCDNGEPYIRKIGEMYGYYYEPVRNRMYFVLHSRCPICRLSGVWIVDLAGSRYWIDGMGRLPDRMCSCRCSVLCTGCIGCDCKSLSSGGAGTVFLSGTTNRYRNESKRN